MIPLRVLAMTALKPALVSPRDPRSSCFRLPVRHIPYGLVCLHTTHTLPLPCPHLVFTATVALSFTSYSGQAGAMKSPSEALPLEV